MRIIPLAHRLRGREATLYICRGLLPINLINLRLFQHRGRTYRIPDSIANNSASSLYKYGIASHRWDPTDYLIEDLCPSRASGLPDPPTARGLKKDWRPSPARLLHPSRNRNQSLDVSVVCHLTTPLDISQVARSEKCDPRPSELHFCGPIAIISLQPRACEPLTQFDSFSSRSTTLL